MVLITVQEANNVSAFYVEYLRLKDQKAFCDSISEVYAYQSLLYKQLCGTKDKQYEGCRLQYDTLEKQYYLMAADRDKQERKAYNRLNWIWKLLALDAVLITALIIK